MQRHVVGLARRSAPNASRSHPPSARRKTRRRVRHPHRRIFKVLRCPRRIKIRQPLHRRVHILHSPGQHRPLRIPIRRRSRRHIHRRKFQESRLVRQPGQRLAAPPPRKLRLPARQPRPANPLGQLQAGELLGRLAVLPPLGVVQQQFHLLHGNAPRRRSRPARPHRQRKQKDKSLHRAPARPNRHTSPQQISAMNLSFAPQVYRPQKNFPHAKILCLLFRAFRHTVLMSMLLQLVPASESRAKSDLESTNKRRTNPLRSEKECFFRFFRP